MLPSSDRCSYGELLKMRFTLTVGQWYAMEMISDAFAPVLRQYRLIRVEAIRPTHTDQPVFELRFSQAKDPAGVCTTRYTLLVLQRGEQFLVARSTHHVPPRFFLMYELTANWLQEHVRVALPAVCDVDEWLNHHTEVGGT
jgi:hypothetical protein